MVRPLHPRSTETATQLRESPLAQSINNQGVPKQHYYRDSKYVWNINKLPSGPPRDRKVMQHFLQAYYAVVSHLDHQIGTMIGQMKKAGVWENTVLIFISDNGYHLGSHGLGNKITMHEESVRVPMFATGPGIARGKRSKSLVSALDLYPTLLTLAGAEVPKWAMGRSLVSMFEDPNTTVRQTVFSECIGVGGKPGQGHRMASDGRYKLILTGAEELYLFDHGKDPAELTNVIDNPEYAKIRKRLESEMAQWMRSIGDRSPPFPLSPARQQTGKSDG
jgi:arylsulfatase A-like enzyme